MSDFEVHERGTTKELELSRNLANKVDENLSDMPDDIKKAYIELQKHYNYQMENNWS